MSIKPINGHILVKVEKLSTTDAGLTRTRDSQEQEYGQVMNAGDSTVLKKGMRIYFKNFSPIKVKIGAEELYFIKEEEVLGIE